MMPKERADLKRHMLTIREGEKTFLAVGNAVTEIINRKLYRGNFETAAAFFRAEFGWSRQHGYLVSREYEAAQSVIYRLHSGEPKIERLSQARAVSKAPKTGRLKVWREAVARTGGKPPSAITIEEVVEELHPPKPAPVSTNPHAEEIKELSLLKKIILDLIDNTIEEGYPLIANGQELSKGDLRYRFEMLTHRLCRGLRDFDDVRRSPPTLSMVQAFVEEQGLDDEAEKYFYYRDRDGWLYKKGAKMVPVKKWKADYRMWLIRGKENAKRYDYAKPTTPIGSDPGPDRYAKYEGLIEG